MKKYVKETVEVGDWKVELVQDEDGHLLVALNHADGTKVIDIEPGCLETNDSEWVTRFTTEGIEKDYREEMGLDKEGTCPFCGKKGKEGEGCPTCPGCWYSNDPVDFEIDPDPDCADLDTKLDEDWLSGMPLE